MSRKNQSKAVVLLSGGLDSSCLAYYAANKDRGAQRLLYTLTIDYGQKHRVELLSARKIAEAVSSRMHKELRLDLTLWGGSALTDAKKKIPAYKKVGPHNKIPITYVPARNTIFLALALSYAEVVGASEIYIGVNSVDYSGYVDCRPLFVKRFQELSDVATVAAVRDRKKIKIKTPLMNLSKTDIVKLGVKLKVDFSKTWSCYKGGKLACGICDSCVLRLKGFAEANVRDPVKYKTHPQFYRSMLKR